MAKSEKDKQVEKLFEVVQAKKAEIKKADKPNWLTNCSFRWDADSNSGSFNIQTVSDPNVLVLAYARLSMLEETSENAAKELGVENYEFKHLGFPAADWKTDFKTRVTKINISKEKTKLAALEARLDKLVSPEQREALELEAIQKELGL